MPPAVNLSLSMADVGCPSAALTPPCAYGSAALALAPKKCPPISSTICTSATCNSMSSKPPRDTNNNDCFIRHANGRFALLCYAFTYHAQFILQLGVPPLPSDRICPSSLCPPTMRSSCADGWVTKRWLERSCSSARQAWRAELPIVSCTRLTALRRLAGLVNFPQGCFQTDQRLQGH